MSRTVAILTGGGDCPGLNAVIQAVVVLSCVMVGGFAKVLQATAAEDGRSARPPRGQC